jgi:hypothetical protein
MAGVPPQTHTELYPDNIKPMATFFCAVADVIGGPGSLTVETGRIEVSGPLFTRPLVHTDPTVVMVKSRLLPPPFRTGWLLDDGSGGWKFVTCVFRQQRLRRELRAAGFSVDQRSKWIYQGNSAL